MKVTLCDVGPRDGLQNEDVRFTPAQRAELAVKLAAAGLPSVEAASFVRDDLVPQMAGAEEVVAGLPLDDGTRWSALVLNERGVERALAAGLREIHVAVMATESFARANTGMGLEQALAGAGRMVRAAHAGGARVVGAVSVAFGCPFEGRVAPEAALRVAEALGDVDELFLADTIGVAVPGQVRRLVRRALELGPPIGVHLHDTRNTGVANAVAALDAGATSFETSVGGLGGCPFAPGATGNLATEDLVWMLDGLGVAHGVDLGALARTSAWMAERLGRPSPSRVVRALTGAAA
jgi:isopropylmalate/homocitrate/citramalate synthase